MQCFLVLSFVKIVKGKTDVKPPGVIGILLNRIINPKESSGIYVVKFNIKPKSGWKGNGSTRAGFNLKGQNLYYKIKNDGSKSNSESSDIEIHCGSINLKNLILQK